MMMVTKVEWSGVEWSGMSVYEVQVSDINIKAKNELNVHRFIVITVYGYSTSLAAERSEKNPNVTKDEYNTVLARENTVPSKVCTIPVLVNRAVM